MADGWRNRYMAPFYALAISFVLVLLLGLTLNAPADPKPPPPTPKPKTSTVEFSSVKDKFPVKSAIVWWGEEKRTVKTLAELQDLKTTGPVHVCALMDKGWVALHAQRLADSKYVCWGPLEPRKPGADITIDVEAGP